MTCHVVAEAGQCHNGSVATALKMVEAASQAGAFGVKFQLLQPDTIARPGAEKYWTDTLGTADQREAFTKAGLIDYGAWREVKDACDAFGVEFLATPFDLPAVEALANLGVRWFKIASGDITYRQLFREVDDTGCQVMVSTGACDLHEIDRALGWLAPERVTLLACTLAYPTPVESAHLARIDTLAATFKRPVGYSDHTSSPDVGMCAAALGSVVNEVHFTLDNHAPDVPDHKIAVNPKRLESYVLASQRGAAARGSDRLGPWDLEEPARLGARRSICAARNLGYGHELTLADLAFLRPGDGIAPFDAHKVLSGHLTKPKQAGEPIGWDDFA